MPSVVKEVRSSATDLTTSYVYNTANNIDGMDQHTLLIEYDPDEDTGILSVIIQVSPDDLNTTDANSSWVQVGAIKWTDANPSVGTHQPRELQVSSTAAGTKKYADWSFNCSCQKIRVGVKETNGSDRGNARITLYSRTS